VMVVHHSLPRCGFFDFVLLVGLLAFLFGVCFVVRL
jgi:hypothetical protein